MLFIVRELVHKAKINARGSNRSEFLKNCPKQYENILNRIDSMKFSDAPDYQYFYSMLSEVEFNKNFN